MKNRAMYQSAEISQVVEHYTEDLKVSGSILGLSSCFLCRYRKSFQLNSKFYWIFFACTEIQ